MSIYLQVDVFMYLLIWLYMKYLPNVSIFPLRIQFLHSLFYLNYLISLNSCLCVSRADTESTSEHLEALKKLSSDLEEQRATLEDLREQRQAILPRLSLLDKELIKQQVPLDFYSSAAISDI